MKKLIWIGLLFSSSLAAAAPLAVDLKQIFDQHNAAILSGDIEKAITFRTASVKAEVLSAIKKPDERKGFELMAKAMVPSAYAIDHVEGDDTNATAYMTGTFQSMDPKQKGQSIRQNLMITFAKEAGQWKMGHVLFTGDPDAVKRSADRSFESESRYDMDKTMTLGGKIVSATFDKDHTVVTLKVLDEEILVFLPPKAELEKSGFKTSLLVPWAMLEVGGHPHKTNSRKVLGTSAEVKAP